MDDKLPTLKALLRGPVLLTCANGCHRQLRAAEVYPNVVLRLRLATVSQEGDADDWRETAEAISTAPVGPVVCPACEESEGDPAGCLLCAGRGLVHGQRWLDWYYETKACRDYAPGCERDCRRTECVHDAARSTQQIPILVLEAQKASKNWAAKGTSLDDWKVAGLAKNQRALLRFLDLVATTTGVLCGDDDEDDEEA